MYGQGNYAPQVGQGPYPSRPPFQLRPPGPPPPPFQQGPPAPRPPVYQHGPPPVPPQVGQPGHPVYQHVPPGPPQQVPPLPVPSSGISSGQSYLSPLPPPPPPPPLQAHGGSQVPHFHSSAQQQSQWAQNVHHIPSAVPSSGPGNVIPPPSHGQALYRGQVPPGGVQVPQHAPPPPPSLPPLSSSFTPPSFGSNAIPMSQHPHMPSMVPPRPPLPSSPPRSPPHPPASSPPKTSSPCSNTQFSENIRSEGFNSDYTIDVVASDSVDRVVAPNQIGDNLSVLCNPSEHDGATASYVQPHSLIDADISHSPSDSDMDMEDDITHPGEEEQTHSYNDPNHGSSPLSTEQDTRVQLQASWSSAKHSLADDTRVGKLSCSVSSGSEEQDQVAGPKVSRDDGESSPGKSSPKLDGSVLSSIGQTEHTVDGIARESSSLHGDSIKPSASTDMAVNGSEKLRNESTKGTSSPFRLLQDYASDDSSEDGHQKDVNLAVVSPSIKAGITSFGTDMNHNLGNGHGPRSLFESEKGFDPIPETSAVCSLSIPPQSTDSSLSQWVVLQADATSIGDGQSKELADNKHDNQEFDEVGSSHKVLQNTNAPRDVVLDGHSRSRNLQKEDPKSVSGILKVDEFGRLVRENHSDCDSGDSPRYTRRRGKRGRSRSRSRSPIRGRSRSRSRSPHDRRRRRRSPWRRRERHGRSRSLSPKRHRSRSKSPSYRRGGEFGGDKMRRDKALPPECFDFIRGKCYRGASCRYLHHESDKTDRSKSYRSKQQEDVSTSSKNSDLYGETETTPPKRSVHEHKSQGSKQDLLVMEKREDVKEELGKPATELCDKEIRLEPLVWRVNTENEKVPGDFTDQIPASKNSETQQSQVHCSDQVVQNADHQPQQMNDPSGPQISPVQTSGTIQSVPPVDRPYLNQDSITQPYAGMSSIDGRFSSQNISSQTSVPELSPSVGNHPSHILPSFPSLSQDASTTFSQQIPRDYNLISPPAKFPLQHSQFPVPSTTSWNSLPPPPPPLPFVNHSIRNVTPGQYGLPSAQFQQNMLPPRSDFPYEASVRPYRTEFPSVSQVGLQETYSAVHEPYRSSYHTESFGPRTLPVSGKALVQPQVGSRPGGEDCMSGRPLQDVYPKSSFSQENLHAQHSPFQTGSPSRRMHSFPGEKMSPGGLSAPSSQTHPYLHQLFYGLPPAPEGVLAHLGEPGKVMPTMSRYASDNLEKDQPSHLSALGVSRISSHFNPYASTFDQPLSSKFSSNILTQEQETSYSNKYGTTYNFSHVPADGPVAKQILPTPVGDQYDPLYDSIEPSSNSDKKPDSGQQREQTDDSDIMLRMSGSNKPLDVEEHNKQKGSGGVAGTISLENDEYGETADAEVGAVENGSASNPLDATDMAAGEVEIDQVKAPGKTKTSKDSKSMKIFKIAIADFVKEVLKPSWRQGNMSKEAFKTIVKKTVDKVSGAMKSHQIPKSRAKIDHYIESSQRKLTKLVMGYVDKYVKV